MAITIQNFKINSITDLEAIAKKYKTSVSPLIGNSTETLWEIPEDSREDFLNVTTFIANASIKDSRAVEAAENTYSRGFWVYLKKYFEEGLTLEEVLGLKDLVDSYNSDTADSIFKNAYGYIYGLRDGGTLDLNSFTVKLSTILKSKLATINTFYGSPNTTKRVDDWFRGATLPFSPIISGTRSDPVIKSSSIISNTIESGRLFEAMISLMAISYVEGTSPTNGAMRWNGTSIDRTGNYLQGETFFRSAQVGSTTDLVFGSSPSFTLTRRLVSTDRYDEYYELKDTNNKVALEVPYRRANASGNTTYEVYNYFDNPAIGSTLSITAMFQRLRNNLKSLLDFIIDRTAGVPDEIDNATFRAAYLYFFSESTNNMTLTSLISSSVIQDAQLIYTKDIVQERWFVSGTNSAKYSASQFEELQAQNFAQVQFVDLKDLPFSGTSLQASAESKFGLASGALTSFNNDAGTNYRNLTYTIIYKETNQQLRTDLLLDSQDFIMARILNSPDYGRDFVLPPEGSDPEVSFNKLTETVYKNYSEGSEAFTLDSSFYNYRYFFGNIYKSRSLAESDLIGYYAALPPVSYGDTAFMNGFGKKSSHPFEIEALLDIYKTSRDYFYRVLLNKSFVNDEEYPLYEKLTISFMAIERFMTSKLENLRDANFFSDADIRNWLESYGLGVLNQFEFFLNERDYKTNIIKSYNELVRLKGSRDVIEVLLRIFEVDDIDVDVRKFLLVDQASVEDIKDGTGTLKFVEVPYSSDNGSREIAAAIGTGRLYEDFISSDKYWNASDVPEATLREAGLDVTETKYLSLSLSENAQPKFVKARYMASAVENLESRLKVDSSPILYRTILNSELFGDASIYNYFLSIKVIYKAIVRLYEKDLGVPESSSAYSKGTYFHGINSDADWGSIDSLLGTMISGYNSTIGNEFTKADFQINTGSLQSDGLGKYNVYKEGTELINYDTSPTGNLLYKYKKIDYTQLTTAAQRIRDNLFTTHVTPEGKLGVSGYASSGQYVLDLFENLNPIRIGQDADKNHLLNYFFSRYYANGNTPTTTESNQFLSKTIDRDELYFKLLEKMVQFPVDMTNGLLTPYFSDSSLFVNSNFKALCEKVFEEVYLSETDPLSEHKLIAKTATITVNSNGAGTAADPWTGTISAVSGLLVNDVISATSGTGNLGNNCIVTITAITPSIAFKAVGGTGKVKPVTGTVFNLSRALKPSVDIVDYNGSTPVAATDVASFLEEALEYINGSGDTTARDSMPAAGSEDMTKKIEEYTTKLFQLVDGLQAIFSSREFMDFSLSVKGSESETLAFVSTAVKLFLSYTTELYSSVYKKNYRSFSESSPLAERVKHSVSATKADFAFYDEKLEVTRT